jgi:enoyl-CoA hydratase/carnithine racemase
MQDTDVRVERTGRVLCVTLNRPEKHNPLSRAVLARLRDIFAEPPDGDLACAVLRGAGERYFAAGGDLRDLAGVRTETDARRMAGEGRAALDALRAFSLPVIALVNGDALGGGAELAVACDLRVMREGAHIGYIQGRLAITSAWGGGPDLAALVGPARALRMTTRCELVPAATALDWGLADAIAPIDAVDATLHDFIAPLLRQSPAALRGFKAVASAVRRGTPRDEQRAIEQDHFAATWTHADHWAAADHLLARRKCALKTRPLTGAGEDPHGH